MDKAILLDGLISFLGFIAFVALHEFAHAWVAERCGDDTPRLQGRVTIDPIAHIDPLGTIILPLLMVVMGATTGHVMMFGWGKPVQVNLNNFRKRQRDDILVSIAGPVMNLLLAVVLLAVMWMGVRCGWGIFESPPFFNLVHLTLFLCFFNLLPIPPLDGGHIFRNLVGMSDEAYAMMSRYSFILFLLVMQSKAVSEFLNVFTDSIMIFLAGMFGWQFR
jgi:Zn-dependent protease